MTPIFMRIWLMKITMQLARLIVAVSLRSAWLIRRACRPGRESPMSPSISALGTSAATESMTIRSTDPERTRASVISRACSPVSGCEISRSSRLTPRRAAYWTSSACSASTKAQVPPIFCISAMTCRVSVVLPEDSWPEISVTRPLGWHPTGSTVSFGDIDCEPPSARQRPDAQGDVQPQGTGGHDLDVVFDLVVAVAHDGALADLLFALRQRGGQRLGAFGVGLAGAFIHEGIPILSDKPQEPRPGGGRVRLRRGSGNYGIKLYCMKIQMWQFDPGQNDGTGRRGPPPCRKPHRLP